MKIMIHRKRKKYVFAYKERELALKNRQLT